MSTKSITTEIKHIAPINVGTLFSGIGAFEEALKQLGIPHNIKFACDNGEIEIIPLDEEERREYKSLLKNKKNLDAEGREKLDNLKHKIAEKNEDMLAHCEELPDNASRTEYINKEYSKYAPEKHNYVKDSYLANYNLNNKDFHTDIRFIKGDEYINQIDIMVGGSPCQSFSTYGKKRGLEDVRGTLFYDYARIIKESQPKIFIYENVAGLLTHDHKRTWSIMIAVWRSLGYEIQYKVLNAADYDHPQLRKRLFLIGFRKDIYTKEYLFPEPKTLTKKSSDFLEKGLVDNRYYLGKKGFEWVTTPEKNLRRSRVNQDIIGCQTANQQDNWIGDFRVESPKPEHLTDDRIYVGTYKNVPAVARKMTPRECLNLMGFSDNFKIVVDDKIAYRQAGNSIVVPVLKEIIITLLPFLK